MYSYLVLPCKLVSAWRVDFVDPKNVAQATKIQIKEQFLEIVLLLSFHRRIYTATQSVKDKKNCIVLDFQLIIFPVRSERYGYWQYG